MTVLAIKRINRDSTVVNRATTTAAEINVDPRNWPDALRVETVGLKGFRFYRRDESNPKRAVYRCGDKTITVLAEGA